MSTITQQEAEVTLEALGAEITGLENILKSLADGITAAKERGDDAEVSRLGVETENAKKTLKAAKEQVTIYTGLAKGKRESPKAQTR